MAMKQFNFNKSSKKQTNKELHFELWNWVIENPGEDKLDWSRWIENGGDVESDYFCFACDEAEVKHNGFNSSCSFCPFCPIDWGKGGRCMENGSLYTKWKDSKFEDTESAIKIRDGWK